MRLFYNVGYKRGLPDPNVLDGVVVHTAAIDSARPTDELVSSGQILFDPNVYLWGLDCEDATRTCAYIATYPWSTIKVPTLDAFGGKRRAWINSGVLPVIETQWPPPIPPDLEKMVHACLQWQYDAGATILIAPAPLITQVHGGLTEYARWLAAADSQAIQFDRPVLLTVAFSEVCFPLLQEGLLDLLSTDRSLDGLYVVMETTHMSPYVASPALAEALLELSYHLGHRQGRQVIINYADTFGLACLAAGATGIVAGYGLKYRRFSLSDYSPGGGGPYPRFASLRTFCRYLASADMERIRDEDLLSEFDSDSTRASKPLLLALSSGKSANDVLGWESERNRTAKAKAHYVQQLRKAVDEIASIGNIKSRVARMRQMNYPAASGRGIKRHCKQNAPRGGESNPEGLMLRADSMNSLLRETFDGEPLDEDGAHVRLWRHALSSFAQRYAGQ